jgi:hypothetical protein
VFYLPLLGAYLFLVRMFGPVLEFKFQTSKGRS